MNRIFRALAFAAAFTAFESPRASAQPVPPAGPQRPTFSPYLSLIGNNNPGLMYYGVVRPQMQMQQQMGAMQQQLLANQNQGQQGAGDQANLLPPTGTVPVFNNTFGYFNRIPLGTGGTTFAGGGGGGGGSFNRFGPSGGSFGTGTFGSGSLGSGSFGRGTFGGPQPSYAPTAKPATFGTPPKR